MCDHVNSINFIIGCIALCFITVVLVVCYLLAKAIGGDEW